MKSLESIWNEHCMTLTLGISNTHDVIMALGKPTLAYDRDGYECLWPIGHTLVYESRHVTSVGAWASMRCTRIGERFTLLAYNDPDPALSREQLHRVLGEPCRMLPPAFDDDLSGDYYILDGKRTIHATFESEDDIRALFFGFEPDADWFARGDPEIREIIQEKMDQMKREHE